MTTALNRLPWFLCFISTAGFSHEVSQRFGGYASSVGESRSMGRFQGRVDGPSFFEGDLKQGLTVSASLERVSYSSGALPDYMKKNFEGTRKTDSNFDVSSDFVYSKRTEASVGGGIATDKVTDTTSARASLGHWFLGDQLRLGVAASGSQTRRPENSILDYDATTITLPPRVGTAAAGVSVKAILNPTTILSGDYTQVQSTDRPRLHSWLLGAKQFIPACECAVHGDLARVINLGDLDTNMATGELTGWQWSLAYLQTLMKKTHMRLAYRFAREDEYTRAYGDHLVFGSDSYTAAFSQEFDDLRFGGGARHVMMDLAATRYIDNQGAGATTMEMGASVKF